MEAVLDLKHHTITSEKHGLHQTPLRQASNGHLLLPLFTPTVDLEVAKCDHQVQHEPNTISDDVSEPVDIETPVEDMAPPLQKPQHANKGNNRGNKRDTPLDKKRCFQGMVKNTKNGVIDVTEHAEALSKVFDVSKGSITYAAVAYKPKKERMPPTAAQVAYNVLLPTSTHMESWMCRPGGSEALQRKADL